MEDNSIKKLEQFILKRLDEQWKERLHAHGNEYLAGYEDALLDIRQFIKKLYERHRRPGDTGHQETEGAGQG